MIEVSSLLLMQANHFNSPTLPSRCVYTLVNAFVEEENDKLSYKRQRLEESGVQVNFVKVGLKFTFTFYL